MFSKDSKSGAPAPTPTPTPTPAAAAAEPSRQATRSSSPSIISRDLTIKGDLTCAGDIQIDGVIEGDVQSRSITVGEGAEIKGTIAGDDIRVCGSVNGEVKGHSVVLAKTAKVTGNVMHQVLAIEPGAFFEGQCRRTDSARPERAAKERPAAAG